MWKRLGIPVLAGLALITACDPATTTRANATSASQIAPAQAMKVFTTFIDRFTAMELRYSPRANDQLTAGPLRASIAFTAATSQGQFVPPTGRPSAVRVFVPRLAGYPRWFFGVGDQPGQHPADSLFVMDQARPGAPWLAETEIGYSPGSPDETPATDAAGYATALAPGTSGLVVPPGQVAARYTDQLGGKPGPRLFPSLDLSGPGLEGPSPSWSRHLGWDDSTTFRPWRLPVFALKAAQGRAVVVIDELQAFSWTAASAAAVLPRFWTAAANDDAVPPPVYWRYAGVTSVRKGLRITLDTVLSFLAVDPPARYHDVPLPYGGSLFEAANVTKSYQRQAEN